MSNGLEWGSMMKVDTRSRAQRLQDEIGHDVRVALGNEMLTRRRVDVLEERSLKLKGRVDDLERWRGQGLWGRLRWLFGWK